MFKNTALAALLLSASGLACPLLDVSVNLGRVNGNPSGSSSGSSCPKYAYGSRGQEWGALCPDYNTCDNGTQQSPIDLPWGQHSQVRRPTFTFPGAQIQGNLTNTGFGPQWAPLQKNESIPEITFDGQTFQFLQWHTHVPTSEHAVGGKYTEGEIHFVFTQGAGTSNVKAVVGVQLEIRKQESPFFAALFRQLDTQGVNAPAVGSNANATISSPFELLLNQNYLREFWTYQGSLTTPPCGEGLRWFVAGKTESLSQAQYNRLAGVSKDNVRALQPWKNQRVNQ